ncbi:hypothetical protein E8E12_007456 [Didymella heteroderae]|uniref:Uncharacterized protein n=1 Tax=Didymella heteroderae TaxID=1769908 RepID=A0A9P4WWB6_9PLEO|nr:hypothetical protein E8E12_007456 [Didymella heteroderae]
MPLKAQPISVVGKTKKRSAQSTEAGRTDHKNKKTKLGRRIGVVIFFSEMDKYKTIRDKAEDHEAGVIDITISNIDGPAYEHGVNPDALYEVEETIREASVDPDALFEVEETVHEEGDEEDLPQAV